MDNGQTYSASAVTQALVKALNARGGIAGRRLDPVVYEFDGSATNYDAGASAACASFTQDHHVDLVVGAIGVWSPILESCLSKAGVPYVADSYEAADATTVARLRTRILANALDLQERYSSVVTVLGKAGYVSKTNVLGVIYEDCSYDVTTYKQTIVPLAARLGVRIGADQSVSCTNGLGDAGQAASTLSNAVLSFRRAGVDRVLIISNQEATALLLFSGSAEAQQYRPGYLLTSGSSVASLGGQLQPGQRAQLRGVGWAPTADVSPSGYGPRTAPQSECLALAKSQGFTPASPTDYTYTLNACEGLLLLRAALLSDNGATAGGAFLRALERLGSSYRSPTALDGATSYSDQRHAGPSHVRAFRWDNGCSCSRYEGATTTVA